VKVWTDEELEWLTPGGHASIEAYYSEGFEKTIYRRKWTRIRGGLYARLVGQHFVEVEKCSPDWCPPGVRGWRYRTTPIGESVGEEASEWPEPTVKDAKEVTESIYGLTPEQRFELFPTTIQDEVRTAVDGYEQGLIERGIDIAQERYNVEEIADLVDADLTEDEVGMAVEAYLEAQDSKTASLRSKPFRNTKRLKTKLLR